MSNSDARKRLAEHEQVAPEKVPLVCPHCGASLIINMETVGPAYLTYERPESIECDAYSSVHCAAVWEPDGTPRYPPEWVRYPDLYSKPTRVLPPGGSS